MASIVWQRCQCQIMIWRAITDELHGKTDCILVTKSRLNSIISLVIFVDRALGVCRQSKNRKCRDTVATGPSTTSLTDTCTSTHRSGGSTNRTWGGIHGWCFSDIWLQNIAHCIKMQQTLTRVLQFFAGGFDSPSFPACQLFILAGNLVGLVFFAFTECYINSDWLSVVECCKILAKIDCHKKYHA